MQYDNAAARACFSYSTDLRLFVMLLYSPDIIPRIFYVFINLKATFKETFFKKTLVQSEKEHCITMEQFLILDKKPPNDHNHTIPSWKQLGCGLHYT